MITHVFFVVILVFGYCYALSQCGHWNRSLSRINEATTRCHKSTKIKKVYDSGLRTCKITRINSIVVQCKVVLIGKFGLSTDHPIFICKPTICHYPRIVGRYRESVGCYRTKVLQLESTRSGLPRTSKITRIDPIVTKLC